eukprot:g40786.t1
MASLHPFASTNKIFCEPGSLASGRPHRNTPPSCNAHISSSFQARSPPCEPPILPNRQVLFVGTEIRDIDIPISGVAMNAYSLLPSRLRAGRPHPFPAPPPSQSPLYHVDAKTHWPVPSSRRERSPQLFLRALAQRSFDKLHP